MITCDRMDCDTQAQRGGLITVQPNGMRASFAVYYACAEHLNILDNAVETWASEETS